MQVNCGYLVFHVAARVVIAVGMVCAFGVPMTQHLRAPVRPQVRLGRGVYRDFVQ